jgi:hypothetical protein
MVTRGGLPCNVIGQAQDEGWQLVPSSAVCDLCDASLDGIGRFMATREAMGSVLEMSG